MEKIKIGNTLLQTDTKAIIKDINKAELQNRTKALQYLRKQMRAKISKKGRSSPGDYPGKMTGNLRKGIGFKKKLKSDPYTSIFGSRAPHSHLLEFGHGDGKSINKRPFFNRTLMEENETIINIMEEKYF